MRKRGVQVVRRVLPSPAVSAWISIAVTYSASWPDSAKTRAAVVAQGEVVVVARQHDVGEPARHQHVVGGPVGVADRDHDLGAARPQAARIRAAGCRGPGRSASRRNSTCRRSPAGDADDPDLQPAESHDRRILQPRQRGAVGLPRVGGEDREGASAMRWRNTPGRNRTRGCPARHVRPDQVGERDDVPPLSKPDSSEGDRVSPAWHTSTGTPRARSALTMAASFGKPPRPSSGAHPIDVVDEDEGEVGLGEASPLGWAVASCRRGASPGREPEPRVWRRLGRAWAGRSPASIGPAARTRPA